MKTKLFFLSTITAGIAVFAFIRHSRKLRLVYNEESGQLIVDLMHRTKCCNDLFIQNMVITLNGEDFKGFDYSDSEKSFTSAIFVDLPDLEAGDLIEVKMKTRCVKKQKNWGRLEIS